MDRMARRKLVHALAIEHAPTARLLEASPISYDNFERKKGRKEHILMAFLKPLSYALSTSPFLFGSPGASSPFLPFLPR